VSIGFRSELKKAFVEGPGNLLSEVEYVNLKCPINSVLNEKTMKLNIDSAK